MSELKEIYRLRFWKKEKMRSISELLNIPLSTLGDYVKRMQSLNISSEKFNELSEEELQSLLFSTGKRYKKEELLPDFKKLSLELKRKGVTLKLLHEEYIDKNPKGYSYSHLCSLYAEWENNSKISMKQRHVPGERLYIDFAGQTIPIIDRETGSVRQCPLFVGSLGLSSYIYAEVTGSQATEDFCKAVANSLSYYGGVPQRIVPDNLKSAVIKANFYEPRLNILFSELAEYYNTIITPARVRKPKDKAKAEHAVLLAERWILAVLRDVTFYSIEEANKSVRMLLEKLNSKQMKMYGKSRWELFIEYDHKELMPLPEEPFKPRELFSETVTKGYHITHLDRYYSVPYQYIGKKVICEISDKFINVWYQNKLIATHLLLQKKYDQSTIKEHMPKSHQAMDEYETITKEGLLGKAELIGSNTYDLICRILDSEGIVLYKKRKCLGILRTAAKANNEEAEQTAAYLMELSQISVDNYRKTLKNKAYQLKRVRPEIVGTESSRRVHENIRGGEAFV